MANAVALLGDFAKFMHESDIRRGVEPRNPSGALHAPQSSGRLRGDQPGYVMRTSLYTRAILNPGATALIAGGLALAVAAAARRQASA